MLQTFLKMNNLMNAAMGSTVPLFSSSLPSPLSSVAYSSLYKYALHDKNKILTEALNPHNIPLDEINNKVIDVHYAFIKSKNILSNSILDSKLGNGDTGIFKVFLDVKKSIFFYDGIYSNRYMQEYVNVLNNHFCKITRLGNGKIKISHLTHHPTDMNNFTFISNVDLNNKQKGQFLSNISFELDENVINNIRCINMNCSVELYNSIINNNYQVNNISEECLFHFSNNQNYDLALYEEVKDELLLNSDLAMDILISLLNK